MARQTNLFDKNGKTRDFRTASDRNKFPTTTPVSSRGASATPPNPPRGGFGPRPPRGQLEIRTPVGGNGRPQAALPPGRQGGAIVPSRGGAIVPSRGGAIVPSPGGALVRSRGGAIVPSPGGALARTNQPAPSQGRPVSAQRAVAQWNQATSRREATARGTFPSDGPAVRRAPGRPGSPSTTPTNPGPLNGRNAGRVANGVGATLVAISEYQQAIDEGYSPEQAAVIAAAAGGGGWGGAAAGGKVGATLGSKLGPKGAAIGGGLGAIGGGLGGSSLAIGAAKALVGAPQGSNNNRNSFPGGLAQANPAMVQQGRGPLTGSMVIQPRQAPAPQAPAPQAPAPQAPAPRPGSSVFAPQVGQPARPPSLAAVATAPSPAPSPAPMTPAVSAPFSGVGPVADGARYQDKLGAAGAMQNPDAPDLERRRAFLDAEDSMSGAKAVRNLKEKRRRLTIELD